MYNIPRNDGTSTRVNYNGSNSYQRVPMTIVENDAGRVQVNAPAQVRVTATYGDGNDKEEVRTVQKVDKANKILLSRSIYSAGTLRCAYLYAVFATFLAQGFVLYLFVSEKGQHFTSNIGYEGDVFNHDVFKRALGRFICFVVILTKGQVDFKNSIDVFFVRSNMGIICGILQALVALFLPVAFVYSLSTSSTFFVDITKTGILLIFIELDTYVYNLVLLGNKKRAAEAVKSLKVECACNGARKFLRNIFMPLYMFGFFFIIWYAALDQYPLAFLFFFLALGIYLTPYFDGFCD